MQWMSDSSQEINDKLVQLHNNNHISETTRQHKYVFRKINGTTTTITKFTIDLIYFSKEARLRLDLACVTLITPHTRRLCMNGCDSMSGEGGREDAQSDATSQDSSMMRVAVCVLFAALDGAGMQLFWKRSRAAGTASINAAEPDMNDK